MNRRFLLPLALLAGVAFATSANAAVTANSVVTAQTPSRGVLQFLNASTPGTYATLYTAGTNGSNCRGLHVNNNDPTATHIVTIQIVNSAVKYGGSNLTTTLAATATSFVTQAVTSVPGTAGAWNGLPVDSDGNAYIALITGDTIQATFATTITSGDQVDLIVSCSDF